MEENSGTKKPRAQKPARSAAKPIDINTVKTSLLGEINAIKQEKEANDPENILLSLTEEITAMIDAKLSVTEQHALLKKHGINIKLSFYKEYISKMELLPQTS